MGGNLNFRGRSRATHIIKKKEKNITDYRVKKKRKEG